MALNNLVENAAKYSPSPLRLPLHCHRRRNGIRIAISDKGFGIRRTELENIFQRFYRIDTSRLKKIGGSGLGLSIVKNIIAKHFGKITVESEEGVGSTFTIYLPVKREQGQLQAP